MTELHWLPSAADWDAQKERIRTLYLDERKELKEVMEIMDKEHGFSAS